MKHGSTVVSLRNLLIFVKVNNVDDVGPEIELFYKRLAHAHYTNFSCEGKCDLPRYSSVGYLVRYSLDHFHLDPGVKLQFNPLINKHTQKNTPHKKLFKN